MKKEKTLNIRKTVQQLKSRITIILHLNNSIIISLVQIINFFYNRIEEKIKFGKKLRQ
jgi:hypothetical protein